MPTARSILLAFGIVVSLPAFGAEAYIFQDDNGVQVMSYSIPPHLARKGYRVVDADTMRTLRVVPPQATADTTQTEEQDRTRRRSDEQLRGLYGSVEEVEAARDRKLEAIDAEIRRLELQIESDTTQNERLAAQAAAAERSGVADSDALHESIERLEQRLAQAAQDLEKRRRERESEASDFDYEIGRMRCLMNRAAAGECLAPESTR